MTRPDARRRRTGRARVGAVEQARQAIGAVVARPARLALTTAGVVLGVGSLVATLGLASTGAAQVSHRFDLIAATQVAARPAPADSPLAEPLAALPDDAADRVADLTGVAAAGTITRLADAGPVRPVGFEDPTIGADPTMPVVAVSPGLFETVLADVVAGRTFDTGHAARADRVAVLGVRAAERLGVTGVDHQPAVMLGDRPFVVVGIIEGAVRHSELIDAVVVPEPTAAALFGWTGPSDLQVRTEPGAAGVVAHQVPIALAPNDPSLIDASAPPPPDRLRAAVEGDVDVLFLLLGAVALLAGAIGIANVMLLSVLERAGEIGLRRALGARPHDIGVQFVAESTIVGALGGLLGGTAGLLTTLAVAAAQQWTPVIEIRVALAAPALGMLVGVIAGAFPAWRAARIEPVDALRR